MLLGILATCALLSFIDLSIHLQEKAGILWLISSLVLLLCGDFIFTKWWCLCAPKLTLESLLCTFNRFLNKFLPRAQIVLHNLVWIANSKLFRGDQVLWLGQDRVLLGGCLVLEWLELGWLGLVVVYSQWESFLCLRRSASHSWCCVSLSLWWKLKLWPSSCRIIPCGVLPGDCYVVWLLVWEEQLF